MRFRPFDGEGQFVLTTQDREIRKLALRGAGANTVAQGVTLACQMIATVILARILMPSDFGLVAMVSTFSLLFLNAGLNGITEAVLQRPEMSRGLASNLFWINFGTGTVLTAAFAGAGGLMARFYHTPRVIGVAVVLSFTIVFTGTSVVHSALLMRGMRFPVVYGNQIVSRIVYVVVSVLFALRGWGYWALVAGTLAQPLSESFGAWILCGWLPSLPRRVPGTGAAVRFAFNVYGRFSFNYFTRNSDNLLVGWRFNAQALGFYKKAYDLFALSEITKSFTPVAISALSRLRNDSEKYERYLLSAISVWAFLGMGLGGAITLGSKSLIRILLGPNWDPAGQVFMFFGPGFGLMFVYAIHGWIHLSIGKPERWLRWGVFEFSFTALLFILGLHWGPAGVAMSWSLSLIVLTVPALLYAGKPIDLTVGPIIRALWKFAVAALLAAGGTALILGLFTSPHIADTSQAVFQFGSVILCFSLLYMLAVALLHGSLAPIYQVVSLLRETAPWGRRPKLAPALSEG